MRALACLLTLMAAPSLARADAATCDGPEECCPKQLIIDLAKKAQVAIGVAFDGLYNVDEKSGTWDADYFLYEAWTPTPGFFPQTEVVNEISRQSSQFDETLMRNGRCVRSRRIHSTLHSRYDLKRFPFDEQKLVLDIADAEYDASDLSYEAAALHLDLDDDARDELTAWSITAKPQFALSTHAFTPAPNAPSYPHAVITVAIRRQIGFYLTRFFLPLFLIVAVAMTVFWIHPEDLSSQIGIGVTCLLAVIAFQFAESTSLPAVAYLTFADRVYAICYFAIALAMMESIWGNTLVRRGLNERADQLDRICRWAFPVGIAAAVALSVVFIG
jgi:hypothetical protein